MFRLKREFPFDDTNSDPISENTEQSTTRNSIRQHCNTIVLVHSKCFVVSLFSALQHNAFVHSLDVQAAMDLCEETVYDIDITHYLKVCSTYLFFPTNRNYLTLLQKICGHLKDQQTDIIDLSMLKQPSQCTELKPFHRLIKGKFMEILNVAFSSILTNREFYFYRGQFFNKIDIKRDMFDDLSVPLSRIPEFVLDKYDSEDSEQQTFTPMELGDGGHSVHANTPLFLHLVCTIEYPGAVSNTSVKVLPTCFGK